MPTETGKDSKGHYKRWGKKGKKYYYKKGDSDSESKAERASHSQGVAIGLSKSKDGWKE
jgi:hypothetical protein